MTTTITKTKETCIFWENLTYVDHAILFPDGSVIGNSFGLNVELRGEIEQGEGVVVDFSLAKKAIKEFIDGPNGIDHKLWVVYGSKSPVHELAEKPNKHPHKSMRFIFINEKDRKEISYDDDILCLVKAMLDEETDKLKSFLNSEVLKIEDAISKVVLSVGETQTCIEKDVDCDEQDEDCLLFRYTHGLPQSTSFGCQNMIHGHYSALKLTIQNRDVPNHRKTCAEQILTALNSELFERRGRLSSEKSINEARYNRTIPDSSIHIYDTNVSTRCKSLCDGFKDRLHTKVKTRDRGLVEYEMYSSPGTDFLGIDNKHPTVENLLAEFSAVVEHYLSQWQEKYGPGQPSLYYELKLTEGLVKGGVHRGQVSVC